MRQDNSAKKKVSDEDSISPVLGQTVQNRLSPVKSGAINYAGAPLVGVFSEIQVERPFEVLELVAGSLPADFPDGTLFCSAQTRFQREDGTVLGTVFCGDGGVTGIRFEKGRVSGSYRYILSDDLKREREKGIRLQRYGTPASPRHHGWFGRIANLSNTNLMPWDKRLFALFEGGLPVEINPRDLSTIGDTDLSGVVRQAFSAHYHVHSNGDTYNFGMRHMPPFKSRIDVYKLGAGALLAERVTSFKMPWTAVMHDFAISENHAFFFIGSARINVNKVALGHTIDDSLEFDKKQAQIVVVPLENPKSLFRIDLEGENRWIWHTANAFEEKGKLVVDVFQYPDAEEGFEWIRHVHTATVPKIEPADVVRYEIDLKNHALSRKTLVEIAAVEFPIIGDQARCRSYRYLYAAGYSGYEAGRDVALWDRVFKYDLANPDAVTRHELSVPGAYPSEPVFVSKSNSASEDDGYLVTRLMYPPKNPGEFTRGEIAVIDAKTLDVRARYALKDKMTTMVFHCVWVG